MPTVLAPTTELVLQTVLLGLAAGFFLAVARREAQAAARRRVRRAGGMR